MNKPRSQVLCSVSHLLERERGGGGGEYELKFTAGVNVFPQMLILLPVGTSATGMVFLVFCSLNMVHYLEQQEI